MLIFFKSRLLALIIFSVTTAGFSAQTFRVACFNVENYLDTPDGGRPVKTPEAKAKVRECIKALKADVISFEEMGGTNAFLELRASLKNEGVDYPYWEHITGYDTNIHVAVLSKFPFTARQPHTDESYLLNGKRFKVSRGFLEVEAKVNDSYSFTLIGAHLKSKRPVPEADEAEIRLEEAKLLREIVDKKLAANPRLNLVVLGYFNDTKDSKPIKALIGRGKAGLFDTRPEEKNGDTIKAEKSYFDDPHITWTHFYGKEDSYSRIDYIMLSYGMKAEWNKEGTYILSVPNWGLASDHRPIVAEFTAEEK